MKHDAVSTWLVGTLAFGTLRETQVPRGPCLSSPTELNSPAPQPGFQMCRKFPAQKLSVREDTYRHFQAQPWKSPQLRPGHQEQRQAISLCPVGIPGSQH